MRSNGPVATKELAMTGREWPGGQLASLGARHRNGRLWLGQPMTTPMHICGGSPVGSAPWNSLARPL
jgi:hypothetical protein